MRRVKRGAPYVGPLQVAQRYPPGFAEGLDRLLRGPPRCGDGAVEMKSPSLLDRGCARKSRGVGVGATLPFANCAFAVGASSFSRQVSCQRLGIEIEQFDCTALSLIAGHPLPAKDRPVIGVVQPATGRRRWPPHIHGQLLLVPGCLALYCRVPLPQLSRDPWSSSTQTPRIAVLADAVGGKAHQYL
jgi:hypothetical protein